MHMHIMMPKYVTSLVTCNFTSILMPHILVLPKARSRGAGYFYLSDKLNNTSQIPKPNPNGPILTECITLRNIMSSIAEERFSTIHGNGKLAISVRTDIVEIGHP